MFTIRRVAQLASGALAAVALLAPIGPAAAAAIPAATTATAAGIPTTAAHAVLRLDTAHEHTTLARVRATSAVSSPWRIRTISYYNALPSKWSWAVSHAAANWNAAGSPIRFVRTSVRSHARLVISVGSTDGAAGMATVGATTRPWVHLSRTWANADATDAYTRVGVMEVLTHELGHVLGFEHTSRSCSLMNATIDLADCHVFPAQLGYYACRVIDPTLDRQLVAAYGGRVRLPSAHWCLIDPRPSALTSVHVSQGGDSPISVSWARPASAPTGSVVDISMWSAQDCTAPAPVTTSYVAPIGSLGWTDGQSADDSTCVRVQAVNRYGLGSTAVSAVVTRAAATTTSATTSATSSATTSEPTPAADPTPAP